MKMHRKKIKHISFTSTSTSLSDKDAFTFDRELSAPNKTNNNVSSKHPVINLRHHLSQSANTKIKYTVLTSAQKSTSSLDDTKEPCSDTTSGLKRGGSQSTKPKSLFSDGNSADQANKLKLVCPVDRDDMVSPAGIVWPAWNNYEHRTSTARSGMPWGSSYIPLLKEIPPDCARRRRFTDIPR